MSPRNHEALLTFDQAHRIIFQAVIIGGRVLSRAFTEAYKQASASSRQAGSSGSSGSNTLSAKSLSMDEACKILHVPPPKGSQADMDAVIGRFKRLFDQNDPNKGGSLYLQSKVLRARERIEMEVRQGEFSSKEARRGERGN